MNWYLKKPDGEVYGPVDLATLQLWATDSRVGPEDQISPDQKSWKSAPDLRELCMDWEVELRDGSKFGPVHVLSVRDLVQDGSVSRRGKITNIRTKKQTVVSEELVPALMGQTLRMQEMIDTLSSQLAEASERGVAPSQPKAAAEEKRRLEEEIRKLTAARERSEQDAAKWKQMYEDKAGLAAATEKNLKTTSSSAKSAEARLDALKKEIETHREMSEQERAESRRREDDLKEQIRSLKSEAQNVRELQQQVEKWKSLYESGRGGDKKKARDTHAGGSDLVPRSKLEEVERKLAQVERSYQQLLRAMNRNLTPRSRGSMPPADNMRRWQVS